MSFGPKIHGQHYNYHEIFCDLCGKRMGTTAQPSVIGSDISWWEGNPLACQACHAHICRGTVDKEGFLALLVQRGTTGEYHKERPVGD